MISKAIRLLALTSCLVSATAFTNAQAAGSVNLMATLRDAPAFTPVEWKVMRTDNDQTVGSSHSHTLNLPLNPGTYTAVATYNGVSRGRTFTVSSTGPVNVVIAMD